MSFGDRIIACLKTIVLIEERTRTLDETLKNVKRIAETSLLDHEKRLIRIETMIEIARPDGGVLRIAPPDQK